MKYPAIVTTEGKHTLAGFPDCPGCQTFAGPGENIEAQARDALEGWLESMLAARDIPRPPSAKVRRKRGARLLLVEVAPLLAVRLGLVWARRAAGLSQRQLAKRAGVSQQQIAKLEHPDANPTLETLESVARALGARLRVEFEPAAGRRALREARYRAVPA